MSARPLNHRMTLALAGGLALVVTTATAGLAIPGDLDPTFGVNGKVTTDLPGNREQASSVAVQPDGKIVAAGTALGSSATYDFALTRYNPDGSLDPTFGGDGIVFTDFVGGTDFASDLAVLLDGKIVAAGRTSGSGTSDFALARYNPDGSLDAAFDGDGRITTDFVGEQDGANSVAIQADGKIVAAGIAVVLVASSSPISPPLSPPPRIYDFALARYNLDGSLDPSFGTDGKVTTDIADSFDIANDADIQPDGKIVVAGSAHLPTVGRIPGGDFALARYTEDGSLDPTFDEDGKVTTDFAGDVDGGFAGAIQRDGKIVVAGGAYTGASDDFALIRYGPDGSLDPTFGGDGRVSTDFAGYIDGARAVSIHRSGRIVAAGDAVVDGPPDFTPDFALAWYKADGSLDPTFGGDGKVSTDFAGGFDTANAIALQMDGKIVAAGVAYVPRDSVFALARYSACRTSSITSSLSCR